MSGNNLTMKALALLIAAAMLSGLAACGDDDDKSKNSNKISKSTSQATRAKDGPNIIEFDDTEDEEDAGGKKTKSGDDEVVTTTTTTAPPRTKKTTTTTTASTTQKSTTAKPTETKTTSKTTTKATTAATQPAPQLNNKYKVVYKNYASEDGNKKFKYPQITGLYDETMQSFYNEYFKKIAAAAVKDNALEYSKGTYEVKYKTKDTLSIVFREASKFTGAAHGYAYAFAITIDLATGNSIIPSESVDMEKASDAITNDTWTLTRSSEGVTKQNIIDYFSQFDEATIQSTLSLDDMIRIKNSGGKYTVSGKTKGNSYLDVNGDPVLILEVNHALGDYVEVQS